MFSIQQEIPFSEKSENGIFVFGNTNTKRKEENK